MKQGVNILVVEGERVWFELLELEALHHSMPLSLQWVAEDEKAIEELEAGCVYDVIVMNPDLPGMDGIETAHRIRTMGVRTPIIGWGVGGRSSKEAACLSAGMNGFMAKSGVSFIGKILRWYRPKK